MAEIRQNNCDIGFIDEMRIQVIGNLIGQW